MIKGSHHTKESKKHLSLLLKGRQFSTETKKKMSKSHKGVHLSEEHSKNIGLSHLGLKYTPWPLKGREKASKSRLGMKLGPRTFEVKEKISQASIEKEKTKSPFYLQLQKILTKIGFVTEKFIRPYRVDFAHLEAKVVVEHDGKTHASFIQRKKDQKKDKDLKAQGWKVIRVREFFLWNET